MGVREGPHFCGSFWKVELNLGNKDGPRVRKEQAGEDLSWQTLFRHQLSVPNPPEFKETLRAAFCYFSLPSSGANVKRNLNAKERQKIQHRASPGWRGPAFATVCTQEGEAKCLAWCSAGTCIMSHYCGHLWTPVWSQESRGTLPAPALLSSACTKLHSTLCPILSHSLCNPVLQVPRQQRLLHWQITPEVLSLKAELQGRICSLGWLPVASNVTYQFVAFTPKGKESPPAHQWEMFTSHWSMDCFCHLSTREDIDSWARWGKAFTASVGWNFSCLIRTNVKE